jgi:alkylhydroperoxidase family enzyme
MPILPYLQQSEVPPEYRDILDRGYNLHRILLHSPKTARASGLMGRHIRFESGLDARLRELAILQVTYLAGAEYEYAHHLKIAKDFGVPDADLDAIRQETNGEPSALEPLAKTALAAAREMTLGVEASPETMQALKAELSASDLVDLVYAIAFYVGFVRITGAFGIEVEDSYGPLLARFPLPDA